MSDNGNQNNRGTSKVTGVHEGLVKKGGVNQTPSTPRPAPPSGQGGSNSSGHGGSGNSTGQTNSNGD